MRRNIKAGFVIAFCMIFVISILSPAQSGRMREAAPREPGDDKAVLRLRVEEVLLPVSVRSSDGKIPSYLERADFIVSEDDKRHEVTAVLNTPANILFILDASGETTSLKNINVNRELALQMIASLGEKDRAAIIAYGDKVDLLSAWTSDKEELRESLSMKFKPGLKSPLYDSLIYAAEEVLPEVEGRRSVILLTDGVDSSNLARFAEALRALHRARATVYIASHTSMLTRLLRPRVYHPLDWYERLDPKVRERSDELRRYVLLLEAAETVLRRLAEETGGVMWNPETRDEFESLGARIIEEIGTEYVIAYTSERRPGDESFHPVKVYITRRDIEVRVRRGVYSNLTDEERKTEGKRR